MKTNHAVIICNRATQYAFREIVKSDEEKKRNEMMQVVIQSIIYEQQEQIEGKLEEHMNELMEVMRKRNNFKGEGQKENEKKKDDKREDEGGKEREQLKEITSYSKRNSGGSSQRGRSPTQGRNRSGHSRNNSKNSNRSWTPIENTKTSKEAESQGSTMMSNEQKSKLESQSESENDINTTDTPIIRTSKVEISEEESEERKAIGNFNKSIGEEDEEQKDIRSFSGNNDFGLGDWNNYTNRRPRIAYFGEDYWNNNNTMEDIQKA